MERKPSTRNPAEEGHLWKGSGKGYVHHRKALLYDCGKLVTFHDASGSRGQKKYYFDHKCIVSPLADQPQRMKIRENGTWAITARVRGALQEMELVGSQLARLWWRYLADEPALCDLHACMLTRHGA